MNSKKHKHRRESMNQEDREFLKKLVIGIGELSVTTGIPMRRISYLTEEGYIKCLPGTKSSTRRFDYENVKRLLNIHRLVDQEGYFLKVAIAKLDSLENPDGKLDANE